MTVPEGHFPEHIVRGGELGDDAYRYVLDFRQRYSAEEVIDLLRGLTGKRVLVVGEAILDEYDYVEPMGKSAKDAVLASRRLRDESQVGGALAVANHLAAFVDQVDLVTALGDRDRREPFIRERLRAKVTPAFITKSDSPTIVKRRIVDQYSGAKLLELYDINDTPIAGEDEDAFLATLEPLLPLADVVVVADFGHGLLTPRAIEAISREARFLALNVQSNAANLGFNNVSRYPRADFISIQEREIRLDRRNRTDALDTLTRELHEAMQARSTLVTRGKFGSLLCTSGAMLSAPSLATHVIDRLGAGDAVFSVAALCAHANMAPEAVNFIVNAVGAVAVTIIGNRSTLDRGEVEDYVRFLLTEVGE